MDIDIELSCNGATDLDSVLGSSLGLAFTLVLGDSTGHSDLYDLGGIMILGYNHALRCQLRLQTSIQPLVVIKVMDINTDLAVVGPCSQTQPQPTAWGPNISNGLSGSTVHSDCDDPFSGMGFGHQHGHRWWPTPQASSWPMLV